MMKITNYCAVVNHTADGLSKFVEEGIRNGWQPFGSICITYLENAVALYSQAMVIYEKE
jgi:hypothetical protein